MDAAEVELAEEARLLGGDVRTETGRLKGRVEKRSTTGWLNDESTTDLGQARVGRRSAAWNRDRARSAAPSRGHSWPPTQPVVARPPSDEGFAFLLPLVREAADSGPT